MSTKADVQSAITAALQNAGKIKNFSGQKPAKKIRGIWGFKDGKAQRERRIISAL